MKTDNMKAYWDSSYLDGGNVEYIEGLYESYLRNPESVSAEWQNYFKEAHSVSDQSMDDVRAYFKKLASHPVVAVADGNSEHAVKESRVAELINAYRAYGHHHANLDPLGLAERKTIPMLTVQYHGLGEADLNTKFHAGNMIGKPNATLREIVDLLEKTYCQTIAVEYMHITDEEEVKWLQREMESVANHPQISKERKLHLLDRLTAAEGLEQYLGTKYVGQKRFSLEGGESQIPMMDSIIRESANHEVEEVIIGMAHRGRLNVLMNILGKSSSQLFDEFEGKLHDDGRSGDVKYHMGFSSNVKLNGKEVHLALAFNPSHLEVVSPVVEGSVRARQRRRDDVQRSQVLPVLIHGDAAVAGQGVVMETINLSQIRGFATGGSIHIVTNNQVGFTTSNPLDSRSTLYCTDVFKMVQAPIFHVNGDDPEAVDFVSRLAARFRARFKKDVALDLICYRRHGHNEADDPSITQPVMYTTIKKLPTTRKLYADKLVAENVMSSEEVSAMQNAYVDKLDAGKDLVEVSDKNENTSKFAPTWSKYIGHELDEVVSTKFDKAKLIELASKLEDIPEGFKLNKQVARVMKARAAMTAGEQLVDWGFAENLAYATLLSNGTPVRLCGQDAGRGTFAHRHAVLHEATSRETFTPLSNLDEEQSPFIVIDSILSEFAVLAYEYGYATADPDALVLWEAQFGDFANGAQVVIDQFISSGEQKWNRFCGLVMLLPHGYEGMGPEHSSARLERYLQLCAQKNMQVCVPSTPAQVFHMLRRQVIRPARKPLIVMTPKSLLRHKLAVSTLDELANGEFQLVLPEVDELDSAKVKRVVMCSGKVYYDLLEARRKEEIKDVAIVRIEQQYPFPREALTAELAKYPKAKETVWCQEEPQNQGAWYQIMHHLTACLGKEQTLSYAGRTASASPATGHAKRHHEEQAALVNQALTINSKTK